MNRTNITKLYVILNYSIQLPYEEPKLVFCHNDLNPQNIIYDSISRNVAILHLEYADINFQALEIARHFYTLRWLHFNNFQLYRGWGRQLFYQFFCLHQVQKKIYRVGNWCMSYLFIFLLFTSMEKNGFVK